MSSFRVNTPLASTNSLRLFSQSQAKMETAIQRLSSGLRINSAKDDAAGQAISQRMQNQIRGQQMAGQNIKSGVDLIQTAEGGMDQIQNILGRMRELAVQSASDNLNVNDRESIDLEYQQLKEEVNRIANSTEYNEMKLLDGGRGGTHGVASSSTTTVDGVSNITDLVTGLNNPNGITIHNDQIYWADSYTDKIQRSNLDGSNVTDLVTGLHNPNGITIHNDQIYWADPATDKIQRSNLDGSNVTDLVTGLSNPIGLTIHNDQIYWSDPATDKIQRSNLDGSNVTDLVTGLSNPIGLTIHNDQIYWSDPATDKIQRSNLDGSNVTDLITGLVDPSGLTIHNDQIYWTAPATDKIQRSNLDGSNITDLLTSDDGLANPYGLTIHNNQIYWSDYSTDKIQRADLNLAGLGDGTSDFTLQIGSNNTTSDQMTFGIDSTTTDSLQLSDTTLSNLEGAQTAINSLDAAIDFLNDQRSNLGAISNRLEFAHSNVYSSIQNTEASLSTIRDADFAVEAANLAKSQILTQVGSTMLAQANNLSQNILSLIQ